MADFGFVGASYVAPSITQDAQDCINWIPEVDPTKGQGARGVVALYPTPGLTSIAALSAQSEVRGLRTVSGGKYMVAVCGPYVYVLDQNFNPSIIGQLSSLYGNVGITDNGVNVYITDGSQRYTWRISNPASATFIASITDNTLTIVTPRSGIVNINQALFGLGVPPETVIISGTGNTWTLNKTIVGTIGPIPMNSSAIEGVITASVAATVLDVTAVSYGTIYVGQSITDSTGSLLPNTVITAYGSGIALDYTITTAGTGYAVNDTVTLLGGVYGNSPATYTVTSVGTDGDVEGLVLTYGGQYTSTPDNPVSTSTSGVGTGLVLTVDFGSGSGEQGSYTINSPDQSVDSETMYLLNFSILPASDGAFSGADVVDTIDNYFVYNNPNTQQWAASDILSPITYGLSYASKFTSPDNLVSLIANNGQVYLLGEKSSEVWSDQGTFPFAFQRIPASSSQHGIIAAFSVARIGNTFAYLSRNTRGQAEIVAMNGYFPERISTHAVEQTLTNEYVADAVAWTYQLEGHEVYVISFPTLNITWAWDYATKLWHKWLWFDNTGNYNRHRGNCAAVFQGLVCVGDWQNGQIYYLDPENYTDNGGTIRRLRRAPHLVQDLQRFYFDELQIQFQPGVGLTGIAVNPVIEQHGSVVEHEVTSLPITYQASPFLITGTYITSPGTQTIVTVFPPVTNETGANPQAMLRWSNDGGFTWSNEHWVSIGMIGRYKNRAIWRRLGWARDRVFEVVVTDPVKAVIVSANLKASVGDN